MAWAGWLCGVRSGVERQLSGGLQFVWQASEACGPMADSRWQSERAHTEKAAAAEL